MRKSLVPAFCLVLLVLVIFGRSHGYSFLLWDDNINTYRNPWYLPLTRDHLVQFWVEPYNSTYRPLVHMGWALLCWLSLRGTPQVIPGGGVTYFDAAVFHDANILLHIINVLLVFKLARRFAHEIGAAIGAAIFAIHPVQVESVCWVTGFNELLCATFCLLSLLCYLNWLGPLSGNPPDSPRSAADVGLAAETSRGKPRWYFASAVWFVLALLVKPAAVALPLIFWTFQVLIYRQSHRSAFRALGAWLVAGALWSIVTALAHPPEHAGAATALWTRPFIAGDALSFYAFKLLIPGVLGIDYGRTPADVLADSWIWFTWLIPAGLGYWAWRFSRNSLSPHRAWPLLVFCCTVGWLLPVCGLKPFHFQLVYSTVADRYLYFVLVPISMALAVAVDVANSARLNSFFWKWGYVLVFILLQQWTQASWDQVPVWRNNYTVFHNAAIANPSSWMAHANLGSAYDTDGDRFAAKQEFRAALERNPQLWQMHIMLARYATTAGNGAEARREWSAALKIDPTLVEARRGLAAKAKP